MFDIIAILIPIVLAVCLVATIRIITNARVQRRLAETHASEELVQALMRSDAAARRITSLKWGLVLTCLGAAFVLIDVLDLDAADPTSYGLLFIATGVGLLAHYVSSARKKT